MQDWQGDFYKSSIKVAVDARKMDQIAVTRNGTIEYDPHNK